MEESKVGVYLEIFTKRGDYEIPFKDVEQLDAYTTQFENKQDLVKTLFGELAELIEAVRIKYVYKTRENKDSKKKDVIKTVVLPFKFSKDNYSEVDLKSVFHNYLENHPEECSKDKWKVVYALVNARYKNNLASNTKDVQTKELTVAIDTVWSKGYKTKRDIYFALKELGYQIEINPTLLFADRQPTLQERLSQMTPVNDYARYLQNQAQHGGEDMALAMEQLSMFDLDDLLIMNAPMDASFDKAKGQITSNSLDTLFEHIETLSPAKRNDLAAEIYRIRDEFLASYRKTKCRK